MHYGDANIKLVLIDRHHLNMVLGTLLKDTRDRLFKGGITFSKHLEKITSAFSPEATIHDQLFQNYGKHMVKELCHQPIANVKYERVSKMLAKAHYSMCYRHERYRRRCKV